MTGENIKTPSFVFDADVLKDRARKIRKVLAQKNIKLCYAIKANPFLIPDLIDEADCLEVCSPGEYDICVKYNVPPEKIVLSGVYKEEHDIMRIVERCGGRTLYTVESPAQFALLEKTAKKSCVTLPVILRLSCGNQFGMDEDTIISLVNKKPNLLNLRGIQFYGGTQKSADKIQSEAEKIQKFVRRLKDACGFDCEHIEYGPGLSVNYFVAAKPQDENAMLTAAFEAFNGASTAVMEVGRFLVASCGEYCTSIVDIKHTFGTTYCITDGGINHLNYYGQIMAMKLPYMSRMRSNKITELTPESTQSGVTLCGALCTTADVLVRSCPLPDPQVGDVLIFKNTGAYSVTEGIYLFLSRDMPSIYRKCNGKVELLRPDLHTYNLNSIQ